MSDDVRVAAIIATAVVMVVGIVVGCAFAVHAGNVKVATACVASGGQWLDSRKDMNGSTAQMECVHS